MILSFKEFLPKYFDGSIQDDAAWRAYDIERIATKRKAMEALKILGYRELNYFGLDQCTRDYNLNTLAKTSHLLSLWWAWARIALGEVKRGIPRREGIDDD